MHTDDIAGAENELKEVVVTAVTKVPKKPMTPEYSKAFLKQINTKKVKAMLVGLSTVGNRLFESPYDPYKILNQTPEQKQQIFTQSAKKTLAIFSIFVLRQQRKQCYCIPSKGKKPSKKS